MTEQSTIAAENVGIVQITQSIENLIFEIRGRQVMLDRDLAMLYGVETKRLNEQVRRNIGRFPRRFYVSAHKGREEWVCHLSGKERIVCLVAKPSTKTFCRHRQKNRIIAAVFIKFLPIVWNTSQSPNLPRNTASADLFTPRVPEARNLNNPIQAQRSGAQCGVRCVHVPAACRRHATSHYSPTNSSGFAT